MKKFYLLTKTLLAAALLCVGQNAWGDEVVLNSTQSAYVDATNSTTNYNGASVEKLQINNTQYRDWSSGNDGSVKFNSGGKVALYKFALSSIKDIGTITGVTFTVKGQTNDANNKSTNPVRVLGYTPSWDASTITQATLTNNGNAEALTGTVSGKGSFQPLNTTAGLTINAGETTLDVNAITYVQSAIDAGNDYVTIALAVNLGRVAYLETSAKLTVTYTTATTYDVTFTETNSVAATVKIDDTDVTSGTKLANGNYSFTATATGYENYNGIFTVSGANKNVEFTMTAKPVYSYTVNAKAGDVVLEKLAEGEGYKDDNVYYHYKQVINYGGTLYQASAISQGYKTSFTLDSNAKVVNHAYSQPGTPVTNVVFLAEGEDVFTRGTGSSADTRCSMGAGGYASSKTAFVNLGPGKYILKISNRCSGDRTGIHNFYKGDEESPFFSANGNGYNAERTSEEFTLTETTTLYMLGGDNNQYVDWLYVVKTGDATVSKTITSAGWATYCSPYALDFTGTGLTAYIVKGTEGETSELDLEEVTTVPANTGVLLEGTAGAYNIPVIANADAVSGNKLVGVLENTGIDAEAGYVLMNETAGVGFYKNKNAFTVGANTAYLPADFATSVVTARAAYFFRGNITEVENVEAAPVATVKKNGAYLENGRIAIYKNGMKFNANGQLVK